MRTCKGVRKYFKDSANVYVIDSSDDSETLLLFVEGPSDPPALLLVPLDSKRIQLIGPVRSVLADTALVRDGDSRSSTQARDGRRADRLSHAPASTAERDEAAARGACRTAAPKRATT